MTINIMSLSEKETKFLTTFASSGKRIIQFNQAVEYFGSKITAKNSLARLNRKNWLQRLERGLYLIIPLEAGPERTWAENTFIIGSNLVTPGAVAYWSALRFWNMTDQLPQVLFIQTPKRKTAVIIQGTEYRFITVRAHHYYGVIQRNLEGMLISVTDREKTILDAAARPDLSGGIIQLASVLRTNTASIDWEKLDRYMVQWGGGVVAKRLGFLVQNMAIPLPEGKERLSRWQSMVSKGISLLEPGLEPKGTVITRWQLQINVKI
jgi:predicted transcriptional regulator of viral defense system